MPLPLILIALAALVLLATQATGLDFSNQPTSADDDASGGLVPMEVTTETTGNFGYDWRPSPNRNDRKGTKVTMLIWHFTASSSFNGAVSWLTNPKAGASAHFVIGRSGEVVQLVDCSEAAWHAPPHNMHSIGIELVNPGYVTVGEDGGWFEPDGTPWDEEGGKPELHTLRFPDGTYRKEYWVPYTEAQLSAAADLIQRIQASPWSACLNDQRGHEDVDPVVGRKVDPGPLFPWEDLVAFNARRGHVTQVV